MIFVKTERLFLRAAQNSDLKPLHEEIFSNTIVTERLFTGGTFTESQSREFFESKFNFDGSEPYGFCVIVERETDQVVGFAGLIQARHLSTDDYEFGFALAQGCWGKGYGTEIGRGQIEWALNDLGMKQVFALANQDNIGSVKVLEKLGLSREGTVTVSGNVSRLVFRATKV